MSTWTWTFIKPEYLSKTAIENLLNDAIKHCGGIYYENYKKHGWDYELKDWLDMHKEEYDYFVNICGVPEEKMTEEYLTEELKKRIEKCEEYVKYYQMVLDGKMTFREMLEKTKDKKQPSKPHLMNYGYSRDFYVIERHGDIYVNIKFEWWRNQRDSENEFYTVDSLIEEVKKSRYLSYYDYELGEYVSENELTPKLEKKLREYYGAIGDNNFYVHFG